MTPPTALLGMYPREMKMQFTQMFTSSSICNISNMESAQMSLNR